MGTMSLPVISIVPRLRLADGGSLLGLGWLADAGGINRAPPVPNHCGASTAGGRELARMAEWLSGQWRGASADILAD